MTLEESYRAVKVLQDLWCDHVSQALRCAIGGFDRVQQAELLFAFVRQYESGADKARILVEGAKTSENFLRGLRNAAATSGAPYRPKCSQQRGEQHPDALQDVSRLLALNGAPNWSGSGWEDAIPRVAASVPNRVDRLRCLGNAIVPEWARFVGEVAVRIHDGLT